VQDSLLVYFRFYVMYNGWDAYDASLWEAGFIEDCFVWDLGISCCAHYSVFCTLWENEKVSIGQNYMLCYNFKVKSMSLSISPMLPPFISLIPRRAPGIRDRRTCLPLPA
jgi:hypothetical protein